MNSRIGDAQRHTKFINEIYEEERARRLAKREEDLALANAELDKIDAEKCELEKDLQSKQDEIVVDERELDRLKMVLQLEEQRKKEANR